MMQEAFIGESIVPVKGTFNTTAMAKGEPGLPTKFIWRDKEYSVDSIVAKWKEASARKKGGELYVRKHWFQIRTTDGSIMKIYFERKAKSKTQWKARWCLYSIKKGA
jgi:phosphoribosylglycinamide formyltransferase-1